MDVKVSNLIEAARELLQYIDDNPVFDKMADCGCGGVDTYRSDPFDAAIDKAKKALADLGVSLGQAAAPPRFVGLSGGSCKI